jgi:putative FmdB family regulatory protein
MNWDERETNRMPYFDMECTNCKQRTEVCCKHEELEALDKKICPHCDHATLERSWSGTNNTRFKFVGSGFYNNDHGKKNGYKGGG